MILRNPPEGLEVFLCPTSPALVDGSELDLANGRDKNYCVRCGGATGWIWWFDTKVGCHGYIGRVRAGVQGTVVDG